MNFPSVETLENALNGTVTMTWRICSSPDLRLTAEKPRNAIWVEQSVRPDDVLLPFPRNRFITVESHLDSLRGQHFVVGTTRRHHLGLVHAFLSSVASQVERSGERIDQVALREFAAWQVLFQAEEVPSLQKQIGLLGELWLLWRLIRNLGAAGLDAWMGPRGEQHDFRIQGLDIEVKTTLDPGRTHTISGLRQLDVKPGESLAVLSLQLQPAGTGQGCSAGEAMERIYNLLDRNTEARNSFVDALEHSGFAFDERHLFAERFCLRSLPMLIPVDEHFPALRRADVEKVLGDIGWRVCSASYRVCLDGLGKPVDECEIEGLSLMNGEEDIYA